MAQQHRSKTIKTWKKLDRRTRVSNSLVIAVMVANWRLDESQTTILLHTVYQAFHNKSLQTILIGTKTQSAATLRLTPTLCFSSAHVCIKLYSHTVPLTLTPHTQNLSGLVYIDWIDLKTHPYGNSGPVPISKWTIWLISCPCGRIRGVLSSCSQMKDSRCSQMNKKQ